jgi:flagellar biosynthesis/type III secretory pathway M-ring protein FliF/YscJ
MVGTWRWNVWFGAFGALLTFVFSLSSNLLSTTLIRCSYAFLAFLVVAFGLRYVVGVALHPSADGTSLKLAEERGAKLDLVTPEDDDLQIRMKEQWADGKNDANSGFQPLKPQRLVSLDDSDPEELAKAIRSLTDE